jgi:hypothetical protein
MDPHQFWRHGSQFLMKPMKFRTLFFVIVHVMFYFNILLFFFSVNIVSIGWPIGAISGLLIVHFCHLVVITGLKIINLHFWDFLKKEISLLLLKMPIAVERVGVYLKRDRSAIVSIRGNPASGPYSIIKDGICHWGFKNNSVSKDGIYHWGCKNNSVSKAGVYQ